MSETPCADTALGSIDVVILAGGLGTRLAGVLKDTPKILAPVDGAPYIAFLLDWLNDAGVRRAVFCLGHLAGQVEAWLAANPRSGMALEAVVEPAPAGTAGALRYAQPKLQSGTVMVMNGDSFVDGDLLAFIDDFQATGAAASVMCVEVPDISRFGRVLIDEDGYIERFAEKDPDAHGAGLINAGVYLFSETYLEKIVSSGAVSLEREIFAVAPTGTIRCFPVQGAFHDIGTPESLAAAAAILAPHRSQSSRSAQP